MLNFHFPLFHDCIQPCHASFAPSSKLVASHAFPFHFRHFILISPVHVGLTDSEHLSRSFLHSLFYLYPDALALQLHLLTANTLIFHYKFLHFSSSFKPGPSYLAPLIFFAFQINICSSVTLHQWLVFIFSKRSVKFLQAIPSHSSPCISISVIIPPLG